MCLRVCKPSLTVGLLPRATDIGRLSLPRIDVIARTFQPEHAHSLALFEFGKEPFGKEPSLTVGLLPRALVTDQSVVELLPHPSGRGHFLVG